MDSTKHGQTPQDGVKHIHSPFVPMSGFARGAVAGVLLLAWVLIGSAAVALSPYGASLWVTLALGAVILLRLLPLVFYRRDFGWFHPLIFGTLLLVLALARAFPLYVWGMQSHSGLPGWDGERLTTLVGLELVLGCLGLLAYYTGFFLPAPRVPSIAFRAPRHPGLKAVAVVLFSAAVFALYMQSQGGMLNHLISWQLGRRQALAGEYYWSFLINFGAIACLVWLSADRGALRNPLFWGCSIVSLMIQFLTTGSRSSLVFLLGIGMMVWMLERQRVRLGKLAVIGLASLVLVGLLGKLRTTIQWEGGVEAVSLSSIGTSLRYSLEEMRARAGSEATAYAVYARVPADVPLLFGESYWSLLVRPVPRALWPGKPITVEGMAGAAFHGANYGKPIGATAEAYWNFYIPGVLLTYLLFGIFHRWIAKSYRQYAGAPGASVLYVLLLYYVIPSTPGIFNFLLAVIPALIVLRFMGALSRRSTEWESKPDPDGPAVRAALGHA